MVLSFRLRRIVVLSFVLALLGFPPEALALNETPDSVFPVTDGTVNCVVQSGNRVYVGGIFTMIGGVSRNRIAAFDATTGVVDANWNPNVNDTVWEIYVSGDKVYVGGKFTTVNGETTRNYLAAFNVADGSDTGTVDANWNPNMDDRVEAVAVSGGKVYAGGGFSTVNGGTTRNCLAAFNLADGIDTGTADANWDPNMSDIVYALAVSGGKVYVGGTFRSANGGTQRNRLAAFNVADGSDTGTVDANWDPNMSREVYALAISGGKVYAGGAFLTVNGVTTRKYLAAFNVADGSDIGTTDAHWDPNLNSSVFTLAVSGSEVCVGGRFTTVNGGTPRNRLAAFNLADENDTGIANAWNPNANNTVHHIDTSGSRIFVGGYFKIIGETQRSCLVGFGGETSAIHWREYAWSGDSTLKWVRSFSALKFNKSTSKIS